MVQVIEHEHQKEIIFNELAAYHKNPQYLAYRKRWDEAFKERDYGSFPVNLDVSVTNHCNISCQMCTRTIARQDMDLWDSGKFFDPKLEYLDFELYKKVINEGAEKNLGAVHLTGHDGEPTMHPRLPDMIEYAKGLGIPDVYTHSNATLLHKKKLGERILQAQPHRIVFSVDSPVKETYEKIRVGADYDRVVGNIRNFVERKRELGLIFPLVKVQMVVMKDNESEVTRFKQLFVDDIGVDAVGYSEYLDYQELNDKREHRIDAAIQGGMTDDYVCDYPYRRLRLDQSGLVYACLVGMAHKLGDARTTSLEQMWKGEYMQFLRNSHMRFGASGTGGCEDCGRQFRREQELISEDDLICSSGE